MHPLLKRYFPSLYYLEKLRKGRHLRALSTEQVFTRIFERHGWLQAESKSGSGSTLEATEAIRQALSALVVEYHISTFLDLPCGDFNWMQHVDLAVDQYIGADIVQDLIDLDNRHYANSTRTFLKLDLLSDQLPKSDILFCRDCLPHLSYSDIYKCLDNLTRSDITYILTTHFMRAHANHNIVTGQWRPLNVMLPPFNFPEPLIVIDEKARGGSSQYYGKSLGLWKISDLKPTVQLRKL
jgi:hypothetical protein